MFGRAKRRNEIRTETACHTIRSSVARPAPAECRRCHLEALWVGSQNQDRAMSAKPQPWTFGSQPPPPVPQCSFTAR